MILKKILFPVFVSLLHVFAFSQQKRLFDYNDGLSNSLINEIYIDSLHFLWVATEDGLNRFDGVRFKSFTNDINPYNSLQNNFVSAIEEGSDGKLWIGQINALQVYNHETESFKEIQLKLPESQNHLFISCILTTSNKDVWLATSAYGIIRIDSKSEEPDYCVSINKKLKSLDVRYILEDKNEIIWIGDSKSIHSYNPKTKSFKTHLTSKNKEIFCLCKGNNDIIYIGYFKGGVAELNLKTGNVTKLISANKNEKNLPVKDMLFDSKGQLWVGTDGFGLKVLNKKTNLLESYTSVHTPFEFLKSKIHSIIEDDAGNIWLGIFQKGLYLIPAPQKAFKNYGYNAFDKNSIGSSYITSIDGNDNELWVGTDGDGLYHINRTNNKVKHIPIKNQSGASVGENILTIYNDSNEYIWVGRYIDGLIRYNKSNGKFKAFDSPEITTSKKAINNITSMVKYNSNELIVGTLGHGICRFDVNKEVFYNGLDLPDSLLVKVPKWIISIYLDQSKNLWIGTYVGLFQINLKTKSLYHYSKENGYLKHNTVDCILADSLNNIWIGTYKGLVKLNLNDNTSTFYDTMNGLCNNVICSIVEDKHNYLWISTHDGLSRFNPIDETFINYYSYDGIQANEFSRNAFFKSDNENLFFGGINGITQANINYLDTKTKVKDIMLTQFLSFDKIINIGDQSGKHVILNKSIVLEDTIKLREKDNVFSIGFTSADFANQSSISYEYTMEGFDLGWIYTGSQNRRATYTNLKHGTYTFLVRAVDKFEKSAPRKLTIIIYPPWYKTVWAKILWTLLIGTFFYGVFQLYMEKVKRLNAEKINEMKMQFFINISHEIKTPLSLIIDPLEKLIHQAKFDDKTSRLFILMQQNANRIFRLVTQMMDIRKIDKGQILTKYQETNIYNFIKEVAQSYEIVANDKQIKFHISTSNPDIEVWIDTLNFEKVILNLLSNAFKFTPTGGEINVDISTSIVKSKKNKETDHLKIIVSDTGIGIKDNDTERIFNRFYQVYSEDARYSHGTGIGLHLSRSLVNLHKGKLYAENRKDTSGSRFIILLPLGNKHLPNQDLLTEKTTIPAPSDKFAITHPIPDDDISTGKPKTNYKILIVEDEDDIRNYLSTELSDQYIITSCENGKKAYEITMTELPDLIISDIMMPEMDGITFCKKVKGNLISSHIPIILLTALSDEENKAEGIETGADMYLIKPFNTNFLKKIINNILENRRKIYHKLQHHKTHEIDNIEVQSHNEVLMQKVMAIIKDNIGDNNLSVEMLAEEIGISRVHINRKLKEITNQSPRDFIKNIRMKQAAYLLTTKKINIGEVGYHVGYPNLSHFSKSFKAYYGISPKEYISQQHNTTTYANPDILHSDNDNLLN